MTRRKIVKSGNRAAKTARGNAAGASTHLEHELAAEVARLAQPVRVGGLGQAIKLDLRHAYGARLEQFQDALERPARALHRRPERGDIIARGLRRLRPGRDEGGAAARLEHGEGALRHLAADSVKDGV